MTEGVIKAKPKKKKNIGKTIGRKISKIFKPSRLIPAYGAYELGDIIYELGGPALSNKMAKAADLPNINTAEDYRNVLGKTLSTSEGWDNLLSGTAEGITEGIEPPEWSKPYAKATKKRMAKRKKPLFKKTKKDILKSIGRRKGGKVGRPKGVGCAIKGYGKAMKRGKKSKR